MIRVVFPILFCFIINSCGEIAGNKNYHSPVTTSSSDFVFRPLTEAERNMYSSAVRDYYNTHLLKTGFNGSILVAKNGEIVLEDYSGLYNFETKEQITAHTPLHLASISKTFTGMTVLKLWEQGRLSLDDSLHKFFPQLPYSGITIQMLLEHRSGLPNYLYFMDSLWDKKQKATNWNVVNFMVEHKPQLTSIPGKSYHYCNTNFLLLALIVEIVTNKPFPQYMKDSVFTPLGLKDTYIFSIVDTPRYVQTYSVTKPFLMDHLDCTYGDKNVYSTVRDLLNWDKALYEHSFVKKSTEDLAYTPYSNETKSMHNYGMGWRLYFNNGDSIIYHNGKWHGSYTAFTRLIQDTATIIVLGNKVNSNIYHSREMGSIFTGNQVINIPEE